MQRVLVASAVFLTVLAVLVTFGPRPAQDTTIRFDPADLGPDLDAYLAGMETAVPGIKPGAERRIVWADTSSRTRTSISIIYIHGFSATNREIRPVVEELSAALGANAYFSRLKGHGLDGQALAEATLNDWVNDMAEAIAIGERLGERVVVVGMSTGATLATWAAGNPRMAAKMAALVMLSPNYGIQGASTGMLNMPWAETLLPAIFGETRQFKPENEEHGHWWTTSYPSRAVFPMAALLDAGRKGDVSRSAVPALFIYSPKDKVVDHVLTRNVYSRWGGDKGELVLKETGDPSNHIIAGDILSPSTTSLVVERTLEFLGSKANIP